MFDVFKNREEPLIDRRASLDGVPVFNAGVSAGLEDERVIITVMRPRRSGFLGRFQPPVLERRVRLDEIGSYVFRLIDGKRSAREIMEEFAQHYKLNRREAELSVIAFLKSLVQRGVISIVIGSCGARINE